MGDGILEVRAMPGDDHLHEQDFDDGQWTPAHRKKSKRKEPIVGFCWKPPSHLPSERGANAPSRSYLLPAAKANHRDRLSV